MYPPRARSKPAPGGNNRRLCLEIRGRRTEKRWRSHEKLGGSRSYAGRSRRTNMSPARTFVKRVNTTYCAFLLGHSQDVGGCPRLQCQPFFSEDLARQPKLVRNHRRPPEPASRSSGEIVERRLGGGQRSAPQCTGRCEGRLCVFPQGAERTKLSPLRASVVPRGDYASGAQNPWKRSRVMLRVSKRLQRVG